MSQGTGVSIQIDRGCNFTSDTYVIAINGAPVDLTNYTATAVFRSTPDAADPGSLVYVALTQASGINLGGTTGQIQFVLTIAQTLLLPKGSCYFDLCTISPANATPPSVKIKQIYAQPFIAPTASQ